jgi:type II secretory pathway component GspD/PulD (secretin)
MITKQTISVARRHLAILVLSIVISPAGMPALPGKAAETNTVIPLIVMEDVPLTDAIKNLARQAGINYILDPRVSGSGPTVSGRWEKKTAEQLLGTVLQEHKLVMVENPVTSVARIASKDQGVKPLAPNQVGADTNKVIPVITLEDVPLDEAIRKLAGQAKLNVSLDPGVGGTTSRPLPTVSFRWENLTARQALAALLDNYDLIIVEDPANSVARIRIKERK